MKIGDRVIYRNLKNTNNNVIGVDIGVLLANEKATVMRIDTYSIGRNILIRLESERPLLLQILGKEMTFWAYNENLVIDKEWYREKKLKELGL